ncbi:MAG: Rieske (2Fe-2S) protein [Candidatus Marinimicrobia bacterium]|nr:Rieske (2Fe-2S) protein [Candidatus Neomarinimicrobiota bacterium]
MSDKIKQSKCACNCFEEKAVDPSRRDFIRKASTLTLIGSTAFILEACGGGSSPTGPDNNGGDTGGGDTGGGDNNGGGTGDTGYNFDASTGTITIDITKIYQSLQTVGSGIVLSGSNTFASLGLIVIRASNSSVRALSRNCTHAGFSVNFDGANNNLPCSQQGGSHGSIFNLDGSVQRGPASRALTSYNASINSEGTIITINQN